MATSGNVQEYSPVAVQEMGLADPNELILINGFCCTIDSLYCKFPDCCGCTSTGECCCIYFLQIACKPVTVKDPKKCCICSKGEVDLISPSTCCQTTNQFFCCDSRCAFPCTNEVPCVLGQCGLICCFNWKCDLKCCAKMKDFKGNSTVSPSR